MKKALWILPFAMLSMLSQAQPYDSTALILIDIQNFYFPGGKVELVESEAAAYKAAELLAHFRANKGLVVHVRHNFEPGGEIHPLVSPENIEKIFTKQEVNAFLNTGLHEYLQQNGIKYVVLAGMQTHMCLEAATRAAHDLDYQCTVIEDACATRDLNYEGALIPAKHVHLSTLSTLKSYGNVLSLNRYLQSR